MGMQPWSIASGPWPIDRAIGMALEWLDVLNKTSIRTSGFASKCKTQYTYLTSSF